MINVIDIELVLGNLFDCPNIIDFILKNSFNCTNVRMFLVV